MPNIFCDSQIIFFWNKLAKLQATLVRNYNLLADGGEV